MSTPRFTNQEIGCEISVVIPCHNSSRSIVRTLDSIEQSTLRPCEVICVDDASTDDTFERIILFASRSALRVWGYHLNAQQSGAAAARNFGSQQATGKYLLFLDSDVVLDIDTIKALTSQLQRQKCSAVVALFREYSLCEQWLAHFQAFMVSFVYQKLDPHNSPCMGTQCLLIIKSAFQELGGFDEAYHGATVEDFDLGYSLRERGHRICISRRAEITHNHRYTLLSFFLNYYRKARDLTLLLLRRPGVSLRATGYHDLSNEIVLIEICIAVSGIFVSGYRNSTFRTILYSMLIILLVTWWDFTTKVAHRWGWFVAPLFIVMRFFVVITGWLGVSAALFRHILHLRTEIL